MFNINKKLSNNVESRKLPTIFINRVCMICALLYIILYLVKGLALQSTFYITFFICVFIAASSLVIFPQKGESLKDKGLYILFSIWCYLIHFVYANNYFIVIQNNLILSKINGFFIASLLITFGGLIIFFPIIRR